MAAAQGESQLDERSSRVLCIYSTDADPDKGDGTCSPGLGNQRHRLLSEETQTALADATAVAEDSLGAIRTARAFAREEDEGSHVARCVDTARGAGMRYGTSGAVRRDEVLGDYPIESAPAKTRPPGAERPPWASSCPPPRRAPRPAPPRSAPRRVVRLSEALAALFALVGRAEGAELWEDRLLAGGLHSFTFRLNVSAFCGIGGAFKGCVGGV